jgi:hypothetical protein
MLPPNAPIPSPRPSMAGGPGPNLSQIRKNPGHDYPKLPRYHRSSSPPPMILTDRDIRILQWTHDFGFITREQVRRLEFNHGGTSQPKKRLGLLYHHAYLDRVWVSVPLAYGSANAAYCLDHRGADVLATETGIGKDELDWRGRDRQRELYFMRHTLALNDALIAFINGAAARRWRLRWSGDRTLRRKLGKANRAGVVPDAVLDMTTPEKEYGFALELDRGTVQEKPFKKKVEAYGELVARGRGRQLLGVDDLRVLFVVAAGDDDGRRLERIVDWTGAAGGGSLFWFAVLSDLVPENVFSGPVWTVAGSPGRHGLIEGE